MRPGSIVQFERIFLASVALRLLGEALSFGTNLKAMALNPNTQTYGPGALIGGMALYCVLGLALWYFAARRQAVWAKWVLAVWFVIASCLTALGLYWGGYGLNLTSFVSLAAFGLFGWGVSYLFTPEAEAWFAKAPPSAG